MMGGAIDADQYFNIIVNAAKSPVWEQGSRIWLMMSSVTGSVENKRVIPTCALQYEAKSDCLSGMQDLTEPKRLQGLEWNEV